MSSVGTGEVEKLIALAASVTKDIVPAAPDESDDAFPSAEEVAPKRAGSNGNGHGSFDKGQQFARSREPTAGDLHMATLLRSVSTSAELLDQHFEPMQWLLQDMIPSEGLAVLGSKMGNGKSYFLLQLAAALSTGTPFLGRQTKRQGVLLIALEDSERRINWRLNQLGVIGTDKLLIATRWAKGKHALEDLRLMLRCHPEVRCVIIDPIVKFIDLIDFNEYGNAYDIMGPIKDILDGLHVAGIFSHHAKKSVSDVDAFDDLLGSTGWGAACDTRLVLRRQRGSDEGTLIAGGRDVLHSESAIIFDGDRGWQYQGAAEDIRMSNERREIIELLEEGPLSAAEIAKRLEKNYNTTRNLLQKMKETGRVIMDGRRYHSAVVSVADSGRKPATVATPTTPTTMTIPTTRMGGEPEDLPFPEEAQP